MCLAFVMYFPKLSIAHCVTMPNPTVIGTINNAGKEQIDWTDKKKRDEYQVIAETRIVNVYCSTYDNSTTISKTLNLEKPKSYFKPVNKCTKMAPPTSTATQVNHNTVFLFSYFTIKYYF